MQSTRGVLSRIAFKGGYIKAELSDRQTALETREFLAAVVKSTQEHRCSRILVVVRESKPLFKVDAHGISDYLALLARNKEARVALLGDSEETRVSHEYIVILARQHGAQVQSFASEADAVGWLTAG